MDDARSTSEGAVRDAGLAALLSLLCTGLGQVYAGRGRRGGVLIALALLHAPALFLLRFLEPSMGVLLAMGGLLAFAVLLFVFALVDAVRCARRAAVPFERRAYNSAGLYAALVVFGALWQVGGMLWVREHAFEAYRIPTQSMSPSVAQGDRILVDKWGTDRLRRGDVVVYHPPGERGRTFIKRVIGLPGEEVRIQGGVVSIDGRPLGYQPEGDGGIARESDGERSWRVRAWAAAHVRDEEPVTVPAGCVYVLGDFRTNSMDSRKHGPVPLGDVVGVAQYVWWPGEEGRFGPVH